MSDPLMQGHEGHKETFDGKRMIYGGFAPLVLYGMPSDELGS
jgi:uncharacterized protein YbaA (DUF1428 family)